MQLAPAHTWTSLRGTRASSAGLPRLPGRTRVVRTRAVVGGHELMQAAADLHASVAGQAQTLAHAANSLYVLADDATTQAAAAATTTASQGGGPFGFLADGFEAFLRVLERNLEKVGTPYPSGFAIILLTIMVKLATFPLSKKSMESTMAIQALQPSIKELQARYANDPETLQLETARLYKAAGVNPLAGCLPTLATIPVFIGLYRALTKAADEGLLTAGFFWIPSLGGPTSIASRAAGTGFSWLFPFQDGAPPIGWHDALSYLVLPVLLVVSQYVSQKVVSPQSQDPQQQQTQAILKFIPFMIGWFSLNVPSGLTLYWLVNNIISTGQQVYMKKTIKVNVPAAVGASGGVIDTTATTVVRPKEERVKRVTGKEMGSRKKRREEGGSASLEEEEGPGEAAPAPAAPSSSSGRGQKFRARKAREAAANAAQVAQQSGNGRRGERFAAQQEAEKPSSQASVAEMDKLKVPDAPPSKD